MSSCSKEPHVNAVEKVKTFDRRNPGECTVPEISVIVPHFNDPAGLTRLLKSLECQMISGTSFEVIISDNGSALPVPSAVVAHPLVTVIEERVPGPGPARNRGVSVARGRILAFIDADCVAQENWIQTIFDYFQSPGAAAVIGGDVRIATRGTRLEPIEAYESIFGYRFELYIRRDSYAGTGNLAMLREVFETVGPFGGIDIAEDQDWGQRASRAGFPPEYVPQMVVLTAARENFAELARKWERHIAHQFAVAYGTKGRIAWVLRSVALAISPVAEIPYVLRSSRVRGGRNRLLAYAVLIRIRVFRARRMISLLAGIDSRSMARNWRNQ